ncbi:MAG: hypothetical protein ND895_01610, partial [Pyrinomonadaceae bacterium]|nr:hypothetical protein [Pyrinomonadaceae bacterium]
MFDNLVESNSHKGDISRKGSFILVTIAVYAVLGTIFFVAGIYMYDAHLENQNLDLITLVAPVPVPPQQNTPEKPDAPKPQKVENNVDVRKELIADVSRTELVPKEISAKASDVPPVRRGVVTMVGSSNTDSSSPLAAGPGTGSGIVSAPTKVDISEPPPPPAPTPPRAPISGGVLNGKAISLPKPAYPPIARQAHASGTVV